MKIETAPLPPDQIEAIEHWLAAGDLFVRAISSHRDLLVVTIAHRLTDPAFKSSVEMEDLIEQAKAIEATLNLFRSVATGRLRLESVNIVAGI